MAPKIILTYFAGRGRAETSRWILAAGEIPYDNKRIKMEEWPQVKQNFPFGGVPFLEYGDKTLAQSMTIARFLAKKAGLAGNDDYEMAQCDMIVDMVIDIYDALKKVFYGGDLEDKVARGKTCIAEDIPKILKNAEKLLKERGGNYFVGNRLTWADIALAEPLSSLTDPTSPTYVKRMPYFGNERLTLLDDFPCLKKLVETVTQNKGIKKWLSERPPNEEEPF